MPQDELRIEILEDGTLKIETDEIGSANHMNADRLLEFMGRLLGGETTRTRRGEATAQTHTHQRQ